MDRDEKEIGTGVKAHTAVVIVAELPGIRILFATESVLCWL